MNNPTKETIKSYFQVLQDSICESIEAIDGGGKFVEDKWERPEGGGGRSRVIVGQHVEKGGVNFSEVHGALPAAAAKNLGVEEANFFATGVSIVLHPKSPMVPIIHMNVRYFEMDNGRFWFGGGIDLTPHYIVKEDAIFFHQSLKDVCDQHSEAYHPKFKEWADNYFYIPHRKETRGVGGIFFDQLTENEDFTKQARFDFVKDVGEAFVPIYTRLLLRNQDWPYGKKEQEWQGVRRGRYVEFNLVWDRGTKFGLETNGRTESILMSMPPIANWAYNFPIEEGSKEAETQSLLKKGIEWV